MSRTSSAARAPVAAVVVLALAACGSVKPSVGPSAEVSCQSAYVDWLDLSGGVKCDAAKAVASAIFMGDDGNDRTSFMRQDFAPVPTVRVAGVGYLPTRVLGLWDCRYGTRRSSYGVVTGRTWAAANGTLRLLYATCRLDAGVVQITTAIDQRADRRDS
jgi:hypothetical protein